MKDYIVSDVKFCYRQKRDWTCSIACLRTICSHKDFLNISEEDVLKKIPSIKPGPQWSSNIKSWGLLPEDTIYGCERTIELEGLLELLRTHNVMMESKYSGGHWLAILSYHVNGHNEAKVELYDPWKDAIRIESAAEVIYMWHDSNNPHYHDFVAIPKSS